MDDKVLVNNLYSETEKHLKNGSNIKNLINEITKYFDRNSDKIFDCKFNENILFLNTDKEIIYKTANLNPTNIKSAIKKSQYIKEKWKIMNEPLNTASAMIIRYFTINKKDKELKVFLTYYAFYFYASLYYKYLPYGAQENVMDYTINNLSNKYLIKQVGTIYKTIEHTVITSHENYKNEIIRGKDSDIANYISALKVRLNNLLKNIKNEYTNNHKNKKYINYDSDCYEEDNFHLADNNSYAIERIADSAVVRLTTYGPDMKFVKFAANLNQVSENEIRNVVMSLSHEDMKTIKRLSQLILGLFLMDEGNKINEVKSRIFLLKSLDIYKKSNTNDKIIIEIKSILDRWLKEFSIKYRKTNREATLSYFRRAIYVYFVLLIQQSA